MILFNSSNTASTDLRDTRSSSRRPRQRNFIDRYSLPGLFPRTRALEARIDNDRLQFFIAEQATPWACLLLRSAAALTSFSVVSLDFAMVPDSECRMPTLKWLPPVACGCRREVGLGPPSNLGGQPVGGHRRGGPTPRRPRPATGRNGVFVQYIRALVFSHVPPPPVCWVGLLLLRCPL